MRWQHFIGGYYSPHAFVTEALAQGVQRRIPLSLAGSFSYGDRVELLWWEGGRAHRIGVFEVTRVSFNAEVTERVGQALAAQGRASYAAGGGLVVRGCGSYVVVGTWSVDAALAEVVAAAREAAAELGVDAECLIGGPLLQVVEPPEPVDEPARFFRGFKRLEAVPDAAPVTETELVGIRGYQKRRNVERRDIQLRLALSHEPALTA